MITSIVLRRILINIFVLGSILWQTESYSQITQLKNGDKISFDGEYYDFRDSAGIQMIKLWIPPGIKIIKGVFISGHGGGGGDSRNFARDENIRAFAMRLGFAVAGLHNFPGRNVYDKGAKVFFNALNEFSKIGTHPEIANLPFVIYGSSNGGATAYGFVNYAPERAICFLANVSGGSNPKIPVDAALKVPGIFIIGKFDALIGQRGIDQTTELIKNARKKGALWTWATEMKGHEDGNSFDVYMKLVEQSIIARYPIDSNPLKSPVKLIELKEENGWLTDLESWDSGLTYVDTFIDYKKEKSTAGWLLNKDMAYVYRAMSTHFNPLIISVLEFDRTYNPNTNPGTMFSLGGPVANSGDKISIVCNTEAFPDWKKIEFFNGADKLGEVTASEKPQIKINLDANVLVYCLTVIATDKTGLQRTCAPFHFFVKDPRLSWDAHLPKPVFKGVKTNAGTKNIGKEISCTKPNVKDSVLVAYGLSPEFEKQFSTEDGEISTFWSKIDSTKDYIPLTARNNAREGAAFNPVITHDCVMNIKAAYGADGLYLLFEISDDNDVAWPNKFSGTENEQFYSQFDAVDAILDSGSLKEIAFPNSMDIFVSKSFGLTNSSKQYQIACGTPKEKALGFLRSLPQPWDMTSTYFSMEDAKQQFGIQIENCKTGYFFKAQEWFIPWSELGGGFANEPDAGTRFAFAAGFNDRDEGEHLPPGYTSSGGSVKASNSIRWIGKSDPWGSGPAQGKPPYNWGEIELGAILK